MLGQNTHIKDRKPYVDERTGRLRFALGVCQQVNGNKKSASYADF